MNCVKRLQSGFTLIELVVVIILLGILAGIAFSRFANTTDQAEASQLQGVAGAIAESVVLYNAQWRADDMPNSIFTEDGTRLNMDPATGYPVDTTNQANDTYYNMGVGECRRLFPALIKTSLTATSSGNANNLSANDLYVRRVNGGGTSPDTCVYYTISEALIAARPNNSGIDPRYPAVSYQPFEGATTTHNLP